MKINKCTAVMAALGVLSLASAAQAANYVVYMTGSTAARQQVFNALTANPGVFAAGPTLKFPGTETGSDNQFVVRGVIGTDTVDINCSFNGSEAGIASVANADLTQVLPLDPNGTNGTPWELPGLKANLTFYLPSVTAQGVLPTYAAATFSALPNGVGNNQGNDLSFPDLAMADTSPAVSRTSPSLVHDFGAIGVVTFTFMKGYEATPDQAWNDVSNITTAQGNVIEAVGPFTTGSAAFLTGVAADSSDSCAIIGRNFGSGTRVDCEDTAVQTPVKATVDQWTWDGNGAGTYSTLYPTNTGTLTFSGDFAPGQTLLEIGDDGYDSGKFVGQTLNVDGTGSGVVLLGYLGISDAKNAFNHTSGGGAATYIKLNGFYESDTNVETGTYVYWGYEHLVGRATASSAGATEAGNALSTTLPTSFSTLGAATGDVSSNPSQSAIIPLTKMAVSRGGNQHLDTGFPK